MVEKLGQKEITVLRCWTMRKKKHELAWAFIETQRHQIPQREINQQGQGPAAIQFELRGTGWPTSWTFVIGGEDYTLGNPCYIRPSAVENTKHMAIDSSRLSTRYEFKHQTIGIPIG